MKIKKIIAFPIVFLLTFIITANLNETDFFQSAGNSFTASAESFVNGYSEKMNYDDKLTYRCVDEGKDGVYDYVTIIKCDTSVVSVDIPSEIDGLPVNVIGIDAFRYCRDLENVTIPDSVSKIDNRAFSDCTNLEGVKLSGSLTHIACDAFNSTAMFRNQTGPIYYADTWVICADKNITAAEIREGTIGIMENAFFSNKALTSVSLPDSLKVIGKSAFYNCQNLTSVSLPDSLKIIDKSAFCGAGLTSANIPDGVEFIGALAYCDCKNLSEIVIPDSVKDIGREAFSKTPWLSDKREKDPMVIVNSVLIDAKNCQGDVVIPDGIERIADIAFSESDITSVKLPDSLVYIGAKAFAQCEKLKSITIPDSVKGSVGMSAFYRCYALEEVTIGRGLKCIAEEAFCECYSLKSVTIPDNVTCVLCEAFAACHNLTDVYIGSGVRVLGTSDTIAGDPYDIFEDCYKLKNITISENNPFFSFDNGILFDKNKTKLIKWFYMDKNAKYTVPDSVTEIGNSAFRLCTDITEITIPDSVVTINDYAFVLCTRLKKINLGNGIKKISKGLFNCCWELESVCIPDTVTDIGESAFVGCYDLKSITMGKNVESIGENAFGSCTSLTEIDIPDNVKYINQKTFKECTSLKNVKIGKKVEVINENAFVNCSNLSEINIPDNVKSMKRSFVNCNKLKKLTIGSGISDIILDMFDHCSELERIDVSENNEIYSSVNGVLFNKKKTVLMKYPAGISQKEYIVPDTVTKIKEKAFKDCMSLQKIKFGENLEEICSDAFKGCINLKTVVVPGKSTEISESSFIHYGEAKYSYEMYVLSDKSTTFYDGLGNVIYIKTDNPDPDSFYISFDGSDSGYGKFSSSRSDIGYNSKDERDRGIVEGGYIWNFSIDIPGDYDFTIIEKDPDNDTKVTACEMKVTIKSYSEAEDEWFDNIIETQTDDSMTNFEKMSAISKYLRSKAFYLTRHNNKSVYLASVPNEPYFLTYRWDSLGAPSITANIAKRIGGFDIVESLFSSYAKYGYRWENGHYLCYCAVGDEHHVYDACPATPTGNVEYSMIDFTDGSQIYSISDECLYKYPGFSGTIYGNENTGVQKYADKYGFNFRNLSEVPEDTEPDVIEPEETISATTESVTQPEPTVLQSGDIDGDGEITLKDAVLIRRYITGGWNIEIDKKSADADGDGEITLKDVVLIRRYITGGWNVIVK